MKDDFFSRKLYPLQDDALRLIHDLKTGFYLSGGTAAARAYLDHRFSEDLDLFVNDDSQFSIWTARIVDLLSEQTRWKTVVLRKDERFLRFTIAEVDATLRIELINDVPAHVGTITEHPLLGRVDSPENILANKVTAAIDRNEPKDLADIWGFCTKLGLSLSAAIEDAHSKAAGIFHADLARILCSATEKDWEAIRWKQPPPVDVFIADLRKLGEELIL